MAESWDSGNRIYIDIREGDSGNETCISVDSWKGDKDKNPNSCIQSDIQTSQLKTNSPEV